MKKIGNSIMAIQQQRAVFVASAAIATATAIWLLSRRRTKRRSSSSDDDPQIQEVLAIAETSLPFADSSPIYNSLNRGGSHTSEFLRLQYYKPDEFEPLECVALKSNPVPVWCHPAINLAHSCLQLFCST